MRAFRGVDQGQRIGEIWVPSGPVASELRTQLRTQLRTDSPHPQECIGVIPDFDPRYALQGQEILAQGQRQTLGIAAKNQSKD
ncbi:hypothetical protein PROH_07660 [Prochlorothrix hollandica PCC 9006 = CALU 1027]|uniref:Uncharacterized protein n=1 Tax=Prochlorothrix hollandica PCC 9006 = CALU 1027 TaxID=317619 RepID=A0A0M2PYI6_PROHO|nr:hypothetical protein PROH_07660 [Prochlorothrix hollandica PCC 9006 = CALU 1027]